MTQRCQTQAKSLPYTQFMSWPEQQHHTITSAPEGPAWVRHHAHLFSVRLKGKVCSHNMQPANVASVLRIMRSAWSCWLCLTCKLSIGDTYKWWQTTRWRAMTGTLFTSELKCKGKKVIFLVSLFLTSFSVLWCFNPIKGIPLCYMKICGVPLLSARMCFT